MDKFELHLVLRYRKSPYLAPAAKNVSLEIAGKSRELTEADTILQSNPQLLVSRKQSDGRHDGGDDTMHGLYCST